jgi:hypothetical protein
MNLSMMRKGAFGTSAVLAVLLGMPGVASAKTYLGTSYGWIDGENSDFEDNTANGWRVFLGLNDDGIFSWELGYGQVSEFVGRTLGNLDVNTWDASLLIGIPIGPIRFFGRAGAVFGTVEGEDLDLDSDDDWTYRYGVGIDAHLGETFGLRFEWDRTPIKSNIADIDVDTASASIFFRF